MKFFKNKFFIIALAVAVFIVIFTATLSIMGQTDPIKNIFNVIATPFRYVGVKIKESVDGFSRYFENMDKLIEENEKLKEENSRLEKELADSKATKEENERLREFIEVKRSYPELKFSDALIIGAGSENYMTVFTLDRGSGDGIRLGMPVVVKEGIVGSVCELGYNWCRVRAITEASASVGAYISRSGEVGVVSGDISLKDTGRCRLTYLPEGADIEVGDLVYTSGLGSVYPRGLLIGRVISVKDNEYLRTVEAEIECAVDFKSLDHVMIITDYKLSDELDQESDQG